jgi:predicted MFS family arabinose efflux permease
MLLSSRISQRDYSLFVFCSKTAGGLFFFINTWVAIGLTGQVNTVSLNLLAAVLPSIFLSVYFGRLADRLDPFFLIKGSEILRLVVMTCYGLLLILKIAISVPLVVVVSFVMSIALELQLIAWRAAVYHSARGGSTLAFNSASVKWGQAGVILGAASAGLIYSETGPFGVITVTALFYMASLSVISRSIKKESVIVENQFEPARVLFRAKDVKRIIANKALIFYYSIILINVSYLYFGNALLAPFVGNQLKLNAVSYGVIDASYSIGAIVGAVIFGWLPGRLSQRATLIIGLTSQGLALILFSFSEKLYTAAFLYFAFGASCQSSIICLTAAQALTHKNHQGQIYSFFNTATGVVGLIIFLLSYKIINSSTPGYIFLALGIICSLVALVIIIFSQFQKFNLREP